MHSTVSYLVQHFLVLKVTCPYTYVQNFYTKEREAWTAKASKDHTLHYLLNIWNFKLLYTYIYVWKYKTILKFILFKNSISLHKTERNKCVMWNCIHSLWIFSNNMFIQNFDGWNRHNISVTFFSLSLYVKTKYKAMLLKMLHSILDVCTAIYI
jgi:hypothetical protein